MKNSRRDNGSGTLRKRKDGRWQGSVQFGYKPNGKPNIKYVYGKTETEAKRKLKELIKLAKLGNKPSINKLIGNKTAFVIVEIIPKNTLNKTLAINHHSHPNYHYVYHDNYQVHV